MRLETLIGAAGEGFAEGQLAAALKRKKGGSSFARAIVDEIAGAYEEDRDAAKNRDKAVEALRNMQEELGGVIEALENFDPPFTCAKCQAEVNEDSDKGWCEACGTCLDCCEHAEEEI